MKLSSKGFSLIELMIVIAIIGVLAAIAIPSYQTYVRKAGYSKLLTLLAEEHLSLTDYYNGNATFPNSINIMGAAIPDGSLYTNVALGSIPAQVIWYNSCIFQTSEGYCSSQVSIQSTDDLGGGNVTMILEPQPDGSLKYGCGLYSDSDPGGTTSLQYLPVACQNTNMYLGF